MNYIALYCIDAEIISNYQTQKDSDIVLWNTTSAISTTSKVTTSSDAHSTTQITEAVPPTQVPSGRSIPILMLFLFHDVYVTPGTVTNKMVSSLEFDTSLTRVKSL